MYDHHSVIIIGGGIAGLTCAKYLNDRGRSFMLLEADEALGGRVKTDVVDGFRLDRGFQILLTNYPEAKKLLLYDELKLQYFDSGAKIRIADKFVELYNPLKKPSKIFSTAMAPIGSFADKMKIYKFVQQVSAVAEDDFFRKEATSTLDFIKKYGWSDQIIQRFFKPFFSGIYLESELSTSSNFFEFVFKQFAKGDAAIPAMGMQAIPEQIEAMLPQKYIRKGVKVKGFEGNEVFLESGDVLKADKIVLATDAVGADQLLSQKVDQQFNSTTCMYFSAEYAPTQDKLLILNGNPRTDLHNMVNNVVVMSNIVPNSAPKGRALVMVNITGTNNIDPKTLLFRVKRDLSGWFGSQVNVWRHLKTYQIPTALPVFDAKANFKRIRLTEKLYRCGDYLSYPSLNAAMQTGREVAQGIIEG
jgi:protoporphyrinogen oxidase